MRIYGVYIDPVEVYCVVWGLAEQSVLETKRAGYDAFACWIADSVDALQTSEELPPVLGLWQPHPHYPGAMRRAFYAGLISAAFRGDRVLMLPPSVVMASLCSRAPVSHSAIKHALEDRFGKKSVTRVLKDVNGLAWYAAGVAITIADMIEAFGFARTCEMFSGYGDEDYWKDDWKDDWKVSADDV